MTKIKPLRLALWSWVLAAPFAAQGAADTLRYRFPLDLPHLFSANFAEMRPNHFHSGIDIKTGGAVGATLRAAADGEIVRIGVQPGGYGRVLYIAHPDGTTTVYGHMLRFTEPVERYLREERYRQRRSTIDCYPEAGRFPVRQGDAIGLTGNSGSSFGPHLHFEVRETASQRTINTLATHMVDVMDDLPPLLIRLHYAEVDTVRGIPVHSPLRTFPLRQTAPGRYMLRDTAAMRVGAKGYFVLEASDRKNGVANTFGLYRVEVRLDGRTVYAYRMDGFLFSSSRDCNAVAFYPLQRSSRNEVFRLAQLDGNPWPYPVMHEQGIVRTRPGERRRVEIEAWDDAGNRSQVTFEVIGGSTPFRGEEPEGARPLDFRQPFAYEARGVSVSIPADALYESIFYRQQRNDRLSGLHPADSSLVVLTEVTSVHSDEVPLRRAFTLAVRAYVPPDLRTRTTMASVSDRGRYHYAGGHWEEGTVRADLRAFGDYCVVADTVPPRIVPLFPEQHPGGRSALSFRVSDNFSGIASVVAAVDGEWVILERDAMRGTVTHVFDDERFPKGADRIFTLTVQDGVGNRSTYRLEYRR